VDAVVWSWNPDIEVLKGVRGGGVRNEMFV
jgi:hypothetical protein